MGYESTPRAIDMLYEWDQSKMVEVTLKDPSDFLKIRESLTRIGIMSKRPADDGRQVLTQSCHLLHKRGKYYILHFKELFCLDGCESDLAVSDIERRNLIISLLHEWGLLTVVNPAAIALTAPMSAIRVVPFNEKKNFCLRAKYTVGAKK